jgi:hypothetical protein
MKCLAIGILVTVLAAPVQANLTLSVTQETTLYERNGFIVESDESGFVREQFLVEENGMIKVYASRDPGGGMAGTSRGPRARTILDDHGRNDVAVS